MSERAKVRLVIEEAENAARQAAQIQEWERINPSVPGEDDYLIQDGPHAGHRTHMGWFHGNGIMCQCGEILGCFTIVITGDEQPRPDSCSVCTARGVASRLRGQSR